MRANGVNKFYKIKVSDSKYIIITRKITYYIENYMQEKIN